MLKRLDFGLASTGTMKLNADAPTKDDCTQQSDAALTMGTLKLRLKQLEESNAGLQFQLDKATSKLLEHQKNVERNEDLLRQVEQLAAELKADHIRFTHLEGQNSALQCQLDKKTVDFDKAVCDLLDSQKENKVLMAQTRNLEAKLGHYEKQNAAFLVQTSIRKYGINNKARKRRVRAATIVQASFRGWVDKKAHKGRIQAVSLVQSCYRGWVEKKAYKILKSCVQAVTLVQACYRGWVDKKAYKMLKTRVQAATLVQASYRGWVDKEAYKMLKARVQAAILIQASYRRALAPTKLKILADPEICPGLMTNNGEDSLLMCREITKSQARTYAHECIVSDEFGQIHHFYRGELVP
jgi:hypothetical protein